MVVGNSSIARAFRANGGAAIISGASDIQIKRALSPWASRPILHLNSAEGIFGGWAAMNIGGGGSMARDDFENIMNQLVYGGSWCCSSWYKPSGAFTYATPAATQVLPNGCGADEAEDAVQAQCTAAQVKRRSFQRPFDFNYVPNGGRDGYFMLSPQHSGA